MFSSIFGIYIARNRPDGLRVDKTNLPNIISKVIPLQPLTKRAPVALHHRKVCLTFKLEFSIFIPAV